MVLPIKKTKKGGTGFVVRDWHFGRVPFWQVEVIKSLAGLLSPEHVEALACKSAIEFSVANQYSPAIAETDSELVVYKQLISRDRG